MNKALFLFSLLLLNGLLNNPVWAACSATMQNASFGTQSSFVINSTVQTTSANFGCYLWDSISLTINHRYNFSQIE